MPFIHELKRRNVFRVAAAYLALAWLVVQVAETLLPVFDFEADVLRVVVVLLATGFWPAVVAAWLFELTPDGLKRDEGQGQDPGVSRQTRGRMNRVIMVSLVLATSCFAVDKFLLSRHDDSIDAKDVSIAVMPFVNLSETDDMVFFSDGWPKTSWACSREPEGFVGLHARLHLRSEIWNSGPGMSASGSVSSMC